MTLRDHLSSLGAALALIAPFLVPSAGLAVVPVVQTYSDGTDDDQDDMSVWLHPSDRSLSTIISSDKGNGTIYVYDLDGSVVQTLASPKPGNVDVRYRIALGGECVDLVAFNERDEERIRVYEVDPVTRTLARVDDGTIATPGGNYGFTLYRHGDGRLYAYTGPKGSGSAVRQYELVDDGAGAITGSATGWVFDESTVEGMVGDDEAGYVYLGEESEGLWRVGALDASDKTMIAAVGDSSGLAADVEGVTLYRAAAGTGYIIASSQGADKFTVLDRQPPHAARGEFTLAGVGNTDGVDVLNVGLGPSYPFGIFTVHSGSPCCPVRAARWDAIAADVGGLTIDTESWDPRSSGPGCSTSATTTTTSTPDSTLTTTTLGSAGVEFVGAVGGVAADASSVATATSVDVQAGDLLLATIATRPHVSTTNVAGLGLDWSPVDSQCAGRGQTGIELWAAQATADASGPVDADLGAVAANVVLAVSVYAGADPQGPLAARAGANTNGVDGACAGGVDSTSYAYALVTTAPVALVHSAVTMRHVTHDPGAQFVERIELSLGAGGAIASAAVSDAPVLGAGPVAVDGSLGGDVDWAALAVEVVAAPAPTPTTSSTTTTMPAPVVGCPVSPLPPGACRGSAPNGSRITIDGGARPKLSWKWKRGDETTLASLGNPQAADASYRVCAYDGDGGGPWMELGLRTGAVCGGKECWRDLRGRGLRYRDGDASPHGVRSAKLEAGSAGKASVTLKAGRENMPAPALAPTGVTLPLTVQLLVGAGPQPECWHAEFAAADRNDDRRFKARGP